ncbi:MAG: hypothetical protein VXX78_03755 [Pseudomonadota bacterium]|nr:hypothetical protein [Pseudomonadota bacterium]
MNKELLLVGSIPLPTAEKVITTFGPPLGNYLHAMPDGEIGARRWWVLRLSFQVFNNHPDIEVLTRPARDSGVERIIPRDRSDMWTFKVREGVEKVRFGDLGTRLGFACDAINSYFVFKTLRDQGLLPPEVRFQVSIPLVNSVIRKSTFTVEGDLERIRPGYEEALKAEMQNIISNIPNQDLAIQFDCSHEITDVNGGIPGEAIEGSIERNIGQIQRLSSIIPQSVSLGLHLCFGTFGGWPRFAPTTLAPTVSFANAAIHAAGRRMDWVNIPTLDVIEDSFFAPLADLNFSETRVFLGAIHNNTTLKARLKVAQKYLPKFGLSAYCGFGRLEPDAMAGIIEDHKLAVTIGREIGIFD